MERCFEVNHSTIQDAFVQDAPRAGRPTKHDQPTTATTTLLVKKSCTDLAGELSKEGINISVATIWRILKNAGLQKMKPTRKAGLTKKMKAGRIAWCLEHQSRTLDDWKSVIWLDEKVVPLY
ncbi:uncharacterized protein N7482_010673 [Penicillium canariense]|uniref:Transposase Tc1-like domain-containing protein n=1 Tax=Penicillium canariense TaxID=189055 RepID=A0A9W9HL36_9EURO|nr:uncharacterized protein N7482_010673 [Penicillium canariense]KAJ5151421.1 hypothetical protein N7482_010673 [Penicillium canariense]